MAKGKKTGGRDFGSPGGPKPGRPKGFGEFRERCRAYTDEALDVLANALRSEDEKLAVEAARLLLERGWGKPSSSPEDLDALAKRPLGDATMAQLLEVLAKTEE